MHQNHNRRKLDNIKTKTDRGKKEAGRRLGTLLVENQKNRQGKMTPTEAPAEYICPISLEVMKDPVMNKQGQSYDRQSILEWLNRGNFDCPLTRQPLKPSSFIPNHSLKMSINTWRRENEFEVDDSTSDDDGEDGNNNEDRFVGLVSYTEEEAEYSTHPGRNASRGSTVDDLSDLLALYNEVLELTNAPLDSPLVQGNRNEHKDVGLKIKQQIR